MLLPVSLHFAPNLSLAPQGSADAAWYAPVAPAGVGLALAAPPVIQAPRVEAPAPTLVEAFYRDALADTDLLHSLRDYWCRGITRAA